MLRRISLAAVVVCLFTATPFSHAQIPSYTAAQITSNNTAACSAPNYGLQLSTNNAPAYCADVFPCSVSLTCYGGPPPWQPFPGGWKDDQLLTGSNFILTPYHDPSPAGDATENPPGNWNISKGRIPSIHFGTPPPFEGDMHTLMYGGNYSMTGTPTKIVVQLQGWFCNGVLNEGDCSTESDYTPDGGYQYVNQYYGHADVQYTGWNPDVANARVIDIWDRGGDTLAVDWYGGPDDCPPLPSSADPQYTYTNPGNVYIQWCDSSDTEAGNKFGDDDSGSQKVMAALQNALPTYRPGAKMDMFLLMDHNAWTWDCKKDTYGTFQYSGKNEPWCAAGKMINDLEYLYNTYYKPNGQLSSSYTTVGSAPSNFPIIGFFQSEANDFPQCTISTPCVYNSVGGVEQTCNSASACFQQVYAQVRTAADSLFGTTNGSGNYYFIFNNDSGCPIMNNGNNTGHPYSDGCYAWPGPYTPTNAQLSLVTKATQGYSYCPGGWGTTGNCNGATGGLEVAADNFYWNSVHHICGANQGLLDGCLGYGGHQLILMGGAFKGFDDLMTNSPNAPGWYGARIATQGCGTTWLNSWNEMSVVAGDGYPTNWYTQANNPLPWMMVATWDDYEEGTEIETGIDNCVESSTFVPTITGSTLSWVFNFDNVVRDPGGLANYNTIDHFDLYYTSDSENYYLASHNIANNCTWHTVYPFVSCPAIDLSPYGLPSGSTLFVEAIGKPGITNWLSQGKIYQ